MQLDLCMALPGVELRVIGRYGEGFLQSGAGGRPVLLLHVDAAAKLGCLRQTAALLGALCTETVGLVQFGESLVQTAKILQRDAPLEPRSAVVGRSGQVSRERVRSLGGLAFAQESFGQTQLRGCREVSRRVGSDFSAPFADTALCVEPGSPDFMLRLPCRSAAPFSAGAGPWHGRLPRLRDRAR